MSSKASISLEMLAVDHPYYCHENNHYSDAPAMEYEALASFLAEWEDADLDMNLIFRWDVREAESGGTYEADVFIMHQRKGIFRPVHVTHVERELVPRFVDLLKRHWRHLNEMWKPLSEEPHHDQP